MTAPVFVVGTGRCGSTLLSQMLAEHPTLTSVSELFSFITDLGSRIAAAFPEAPLDGEAFWALLATPWPRQNLLLRHGLVMDEVIYPFGPNARFTREGGLPAISAALLPHLFADPDAAFEALKAAMCARPMAPIGDHYRALFAWLTARDGGQSWVERSGGTLRVAHRLRAEFPEARFVHLVRDGRNCALSMSRHHGFRMAMVATQLLEFLSVDAFDSQDRSEVDDLPADLVDLLPEHFTARAFSNFDLPAAMCGHYWSGEVIAGLEALAGLGEDRLLTLHYEDFLDHPAPTVRRLGAWLDPEALDEAWIARCVARVGRARSAWETLPASSRAELDGACRPGHEALHASGVAR